MNETVVSEIMLVFGAGGMVLHNYCEFFKGDCSQSIHQILEGTAQPRLSSQKFLSMRDSCSALIQFLDRHGRRTAMFEKL